MIRYPVKPLGDGTNKIVDASGQVLGTMEIVEALNEGRGRPKTAHHEAARGSRANT